MQRDDVCPEGLLPVLGGDVGERRENAIRRVADEEVERAELRLDLVEECVALLIAPISWKQPLSAMRVSVRVSD